MNMRFLVGILSVLAAMPALADVAVTLPDGPGGSIPADFSGTLVVTDTGIELTLDDGAVLSSEFMNQVRAIAGPAYDLNLTIIGTGSVNIDPDVPLPGSFTFYGDNVSIGDPGSDTTLTLAQSQADTITLSDNITPAGNDTNQNNDRNGPKHKSNNNGPANLVVTPTGNNGNTAIPANTGGTIDTTGGASGILTLRTPGAIGTNTGTTSGGVDLIITNPTVQPRPVELPDLPIEPLEVPDDPPADDRRGPKHKLDNQLVAFLQFADVSFLQIAPLEAVVIDYEQLTIDPGVWLYSQQSYITSSISIGSEVTFSGATSYLTGSTASIVSYNSAYFYNSAVVTFSAAFVPEPATLTLLGVGMLALLRRRR